VNGRLWDLSGSRRLDRITSADGFRAFRRRLGLPVPDGWNVIAQEGTVTAADRVETFLPRVEPRPGGRPAST
jgi:hypothetical protein